MAWPVPATASTNAARLAVPLLPRTALLILLGVGTALFGWVGFLLIDPTNDGLSDCWGVDGAFYLAYAIGVSAGPGGRRRGVVLHVACAAAGFLAGGTLAGVEPGRLLAMIPGNVAAGLAFALVYQRGGGTASWVPRTAEESARLIAAIAPGPIIGVLLGAYPATGWGGSADIHTSLWALARQFSFLAVAAHCMIPLLFQAPTSLLRFPRLRWLPVYALAAAIGLLGQPLLMDLPLSWLIILPAALAGLVFTVRSAGLMAFALIMLYVVIPYPEGAVEVQRGPVSPEILADFMLGFVSHVAATVAVFREHLAHLRAEAAARVRAESAQHELLDGVIQSITHGLLLTDGDGRVAMSNAAVSALVGEAIPDQVTQEWARGAQLQSADVRRIVGSPNWVSMLRPPPGEAIRTEVAVGSAATETRRVSVSSQALTIGPDRLSLILIRDITRAHARQQELEAFAGTVAHDLKGPLTALAGWMEAAADEFEEGDAASGQRLLSRARDAVFRMQTLIDDYLAYAVSRGGVLTLTEVPLAVVVREIVDVYAAAGEHLGATFDIDTPHVLHADAALTRQLMANIIGNGVKYARDGEAAHLRISSLDEAPGWAEVQVADRGRGLQPGDEDRIFLAFSRSDKDATAVAGVGLGLALCHAIVTRHGGRISAENNAWGGATFRFTMPTVGTVEA